MNRLPSDLFLFLNEESHTKTIKELKTILEKFQEETFRQRRKLNLVFKNLLWSLSTKNYSRSYSILKLLKEYAFPQFDDPDHNLLTCILVESMKGTLKLFQTVYETLNLYFEELPTFVFCQSYVFTPQEIQNATNDLFETYDCTDDILFKVSFWGNILELACCLGSPKLVAYLLSLPDLPKDRSVIYLGTTLELHNPPLLAYAILAGNTNVAQFLLDQPDQADPDNLVLQTLALFQLYWLNTWKNPNDSSWSLLSMKWTADLVFDEIYQFSTLLLPDSLENPTPPHSLPMQLSQWVVAQGWIAPLEVLRHWFSTGQYGRKEAVEIIASYEANMNESIITNELPRNSQRRIFGLSGIFLRYVPGIGTEPDFGNFLLKSGFPLEHRETPPETDLFSLFNFPDQDQDLSGAVLEEKVMEDIQAGLTQMDQPVKISSYEVILNYLAIENELQMRILQLLHRTCGVELCGKATSTSLEFFPYRLSRSSSQLLLECCTRDQTPLEHCGWIAQLIARRGSIDTLKTALKNGLLDGEPLPEFIRLLNENNKYDLISIILTDGPQQDGKYSL